MDFREQRKQQLGIRSIGEKVKSGQVSSRIDPALYIHGPKEFDFLTQRWAKQETMFFLGGSGSGKSSLTLYFFKKMLENNPDPNSVCVFFSLEMTEDQIYRSWKKIIKGDHSLSDRLYVISNFTEEGKPRDLTTGGILAECQKIKQGLNVELLSVAIDHLQIICENSLNESINRICGKLRLASVELNTFMIVLSQTTKINQAEYSDIPLFKSDGFGGSAITWYATWILSIHQPLKRIFKQAKMPVLAWSYVKIRNLEKDDGGVENSFKLLHYDLDTGTPRKMSREELSMFNHFWSMVQEMRTAEDKNKGRKLPSYEVRDEALGSDEEIELELSALDNIETN